MPRLHRQQMTTLYYRPYSITSNQLISQSIINSGQSTTEKKVPINISQPALGNCINALRLPHARTHWPTHGRRRETVGLYLWGVATSG